MKQKYFIFGLIAIAPILIILSLLIFVFNKDDNESNLVEQKLDTSEAELIVITLDNYKEALINEDGEKAITFLDSNTKDYYNDILDKILYFEKNEVEALSITDKYFVLFARGFISKEEILSFKEDDLLIYAIDKGLVGNDSLPETFNKSEVIVKKNSAKANMGTRSNPIYLNFKKEGGAWKINLTTLLPEFNLVYEKLRNEQNMTANEFVFYLIELDLPEVTDDVWNPIVSK